MKLTPAILIAVASLIVGGTVAATASSSNHTYTGCVKKSTGVLRVIDTGKSCTSSESKITWNEKGPQGPPGERGPRGFRGQDGTGGSTTVVNGERTPDGTQIAANTQEGFQSNCPDGTIPIGRNFFAANPVTLFSDESEVSPSGTRSWAITLDNASANSVTIFLQAICLGGAAVD